MGFRKCKERTRVFFNLGCTFLIMAGVVGLSACAGLPAPVVTAPRSATQPATEQSIPQTGGNPACTAPAKPTDPLTEGPYFKAGSPERASLLDAGTKGTKLVLSGTVFTIGCSPAAHALLDFWQADSNGHYDNTGYTLRGHQYTDTNGHYQLTTIVPGLYPGRTEHIHVKVQAAGGPVLTTQLFFPNVPQNESDGIFDASLVLNTQPAADGLQATFNFIVPDH